MDAGLGRTCIYRVTAEGCGTSIATDHHDSIVGRTETNAGITCYAPIAQGFLLLVVFHGGISPSQSNTLVALRRTVLVGLKGQTGAVSAVRGWRCLAFKGLLT
jgi:hypothetical protein